MAPPSQVGGRACRVVRHQAAAGSLDWGTLTRLLDPQPRSPRLVTPSASGDLAHLAAWVGRQHEGNRNDGMFWAAEAGDEAALAELAAAARSAGLDGREITVTIRSAWRTAGHRQPEHRGGRECAL